MTSPSIRVTIVVDSAAPSCEGDCAIDWLKAEHQVLARQKVSQETGGEAALEFLDIRAAAHDARQSALVRRVQSEKLPLPVLVVNGNPHITGPFDVRMLLDMIEVAMEHDL